MERMRGGGISGACAASENSMEGRGAENSDFKGTAREALSGSTKIAETIRECVAGLQQSIAQSITGDRGFLAPGWQMLFLASRCCIAEHILPWQHEDPVFAVLQRAGRACSHASNKRSAPALRRRRFGFWP